MGVKIEYFIKIANIFFLKERKFSVFKGVIWIISPYLSYCFTLSPITTLPTKYTQRFSIENCPLTLYYSE